MSIFFEYEELSHINKTECETRGCKLHFDTKITKVPCQDAEISVCGEGQFSVIFGCSLFHY